MVGRTAKGDAWRRVEEAEVAARTKLQSAEARLSALLKRAEELQDELLEGRRNKDEEVPVARIRNDTAVCCACDV